MTEERDLSLDGLHAVEEPEPDFSEQFKEQEKQNTGAFKAMALMALARNGGKLKITADELGVTIPKLKQWQRDARKGKVGEPVELAKTSSLVHTRRQLGLLVNTILENLPSRLAVATLSEQVKAVQALVPLMKEIDEATRPKKAPEMSKEELTEMAKKRLAEMKNGKDKSAD